MRRLKVLLGAYACDPFQGSEQAVGWGWLNAIKRNHEVWVVTADWLRERIEAATRAASAEFGNVRFLYLPPRFWHYREPSRFWQGCERSTFKPLMHWAYRRWQLEAYQFAAELHRSVGFDLVHQLTYVGFRFPGHLWKLDVPFVWGPLGGLENTPWRLIPANGVRGAAYYTARNIVNSAHRRFLRAPRNAFKRASAVIAATSGIQAEISHWYGMPSEVICEVGSPSEPAMEYSVRAPGQPLRIAWSGRHLPGKALHLLLRALSRLPETTNWRLDVYGDGPWTSTWQRLAARLDIGSRCEWHGQVSRAAALAGLKSAHLFVTTSLKDLTSTVVLEALANGVPIVCPDHCGFADVVNDRCGIKIPIRRVREFVAGLSGSIVTIANDERVRRRLAEGALLRALDYSWEAKSQAIDRIYDRVLRAFDEKSNSPVMTEASAYSSL
jgi:glycosyltransferase involved in cell wall biosynthesis